MKTADDPVEHALKKYALLAHGPNASHPLDWERFYKFVVLAHVRRKGWDSGDVARRLEGYGMPSAKAQTMGEIYWHGRCILRIKTRWAQGDYAGWLRKNGFRPN